MDSCHPLLSGCLGLIGSDLDIGEVCPPGPLLPCTVYDLSDDWVPEMACPPYLFPSYKGPILHPCSLPDVEVL